MSRFGLRLLGLTTLLTVLSAVFASTSFASGGPFMPCCFNVSGAEVHNMACCLHNIAMHCCQRFF